MKRSIFFFAILLVAGCGGYAWKPAAGPAEKPKAPDCTFKVTETPPPEGYWRELGTFSGGSADTVADMVKAIRPEACRAGTELLVPEESGGKYVRAAAFASRKSD